MTGTCDICHPEYAMPAIGVFFLEGGCPAARGVEIQALCVQHFISADPIKDHMLRLAGGIPMKGGDPLDNASGSLEVSE